MSLRCVTAACLSGIALLFAGCGRQDATPSDAALVKARRENPVVAVEQELNDCIRRYQQGDAKALSFLRGGATNICVVRVTPSANTNLPSVDAVLLVDGQRHYLEIPISVFPTLFIETMPPPPAEPEFRRYLDQQVERVLKGQECDLRLSPHYQWTNIVVESLTVPSNYKSTYPYQAESILSAQGRAPDTQTPVQFRLHADIRYMEEDRWFVSLKEITP
jgi:hypothetical protein